MSRGPGDTIEGVPELASRYEILGALGEGSSGVVYRARQRSTGQAIALKVLRGGDDPARAARVTREAALCARLRHPPIVPLVDAAHTADGARYLAFAWLPGEPLDAVLAREGASGGA